MFPFKPCLAGIPGGVGPDDGRPAKRDLPWRPPLAFAETRMQADGGQSYYPSGGSSRIVQLTLGEAIDQAVAGDIEPEQVVRQLPQQLQAVLDAFAQKAFSRKLDTLSSDQCRTVLAMLSQLIGQMDNKSPARPAPAAPSRRPQASCAAARPGPQPRAWGPAKTAAALALLAAAAYALWKWVL